MNERDRQRGQPIDDGGVAAREPLDPRGDLWAYGARRQEPARPIHPEPRVVGVVREGVRGRCARGNALIGKQPVHPREPPRRLLPHGQLADLIELDAGHLLEKQPVPILPRVDDRAVTGGRAEAGGLQDRPVGLDLPPGIVHERRLHPAGPFEHRRAAQVLEHHPQPRAVPALDIELLERRARLVWGPAPCEACDANVLAEVPGEHALEGVLQIAHVHVARRRIDNDGGSSLDLEQRHVCTPS